jgi:hypothetical protein
MSQSITLHRAPAPAVETRNFSRVGPATSRNPRYTAKHVPGFCRRPPSHDGSPLPLAAPSRPPLPLAATTMPLVSARLSISGGTRPVRRRRWRRAARLSVSSMATETPRTEEQQPSPSEEERFDWLDQWYPLALVCDLDPHMPHGKTVLGLSIMDHSTTVAPASGASSTMPARTAWRCSPRAESMTRGASSAYTTAGVSTAPAPASSSPRHRPSPADAHEEHGVRGVVPLRGAEQHPVVLPEG